MENINTNYGKLICIYDLKNRSLITTIEDNLDFQNPDYVLCFKIVNEEDFKYNDVDISFEDFPWKTYHKLNSEIFVNHNFANGNNDFKKTAWHHWKTYGIKEERSFSYVNNTNNHRARFGNLFFINMCLHFFSQKYNLKTSYKYEKQFNKLGIYFNKGTKIYNKNLLLNESNFINLFESDLTPKNIIIDNNVWFHTKEFCIMIKEYFKRNNLFFSVKNHNKYRNRYKNNNDLFIHLRLGDVTDKTKKFAKYYIKVLEYLQFDKGYISSDSIDNQLCIKLIKKYNLEIIDRPETDTIMFGSTCKNIILSGGSFSWLIGFLAHPSSNIFYPELPEKWYGDIFSFTDWNKITK